MGWLTLSDLILEILQKPQESVWVYKSLRKAWVRAVESK